MMGNMKWKKTGAALLVAGMTLTGAGYAWANENLFDTVDLSKLNSKNDEETTGNSVQAVVTIPEKSVKPSTDQSTVKVVDATEKERDLPEIPVGYTAGDLEALIKAYENAGSPTAKAEIKRNIERAIAKFEASQKEEAKNQGQTVVKIPTEDSTKKEEKAEHKEESKALQEKHKEERKVLQAKQKEERKALKEVGEKEKNDHKDLKEKHKEDRKAEKHEHKKYKNDENENED